MSQSIRASISLGNSKKIIYPENNAIILDYQVFDVIAVPVCIKYNFRGNVESSFVHHQE